jgi:hypothetical protein
VLNIDNTIKPIYGNQEGVEVGYNPKKPGRPSHNYHTYMIGSPGTPSVRNFFDRCALDVLKPAFSTLLFIL